MQMPQPLQRSGRYTSLGTCDQFSGLWHHQQLNGQPFRNRVVRMPGPSCVENRIMLKMVPVADSGPATDGKKQRWDAEPIRVVGIER
jgi:hypothetical protein